MADLRDMQISFDAIELDASGLSGQTLDMMGEEQKIELDLIGTPFRGPPGKDGDDGQPGREVELENDGTSINWRYVNEPDWTTLVGLDDLKGDKGDKGDDGDDGRSAYEVWLGAGNTGTVDDYIASLKGDKGDKGDAGESFPDVVGSGVFGRAMGAWTELGGAALLNVGQTAGSVAAGNDSRITSALQPNAIGTTVQAYNPNLTLYADGQTPSNFTLSIVDSADVAAWQDSLSLVPGTDVQAQSSRLSALQNAAWTANQMIYLTGGNTAAVTSLTAYGRTLMGLADVAALRSNLGLGDAAYKNTGTTTGTLAAGDDSRIVNAIQTAAIGVTVQGYSANLQALSGQASTSFGRGLLNTTSYAAIATSMGLGGAAYLNVGTATGTVMAGDDSRVVATVQRGGDTMTGPLTLNADPSSNLHAATKQYVDTMVSGALRFKNNIDCSTNPNYPAAAVGDSYIVSVAGRIGGAAGKVVDMGDMVVCRLATLGGDEAAVGANWFVLEHNLQGALLSANNLGDIVNAATARTNLGLAIGTNVQAYNSKLQNISSVTVAANQIFYFISSTAVAATSLTTYGRTLIGLADAAALRTNLGLVISTNVQAWSAKLDTLAALTWAADQISYQTGTGTLGVTALTAQGRTFLTATDQAGQRTAMGLGTAAVQNIGTSGATVPLLSTSNTWSSGQTFNSMPTVNHGGANLLALTRTGSVINANVSLTNDAGTIYYGNSDGVSFAVGSNANLSSSANQWMIVTSTMTTVRGLTTSNAQITGGSITGITDITVADGGTGVSSLTAGYVKANGASPFTSSATIPVADVSGLGTAAVQNIGTTGANVPLLSTTNTWSANQTLSGLGAGVTTRALIFDSDAGATNGFYFRTLSADRWRFTKNSTDNFNIVRCDDTGASLGVVLAIDRLTGQMTYGGHITPLTTNSYTLGSITNVWSAAYVADDPYAPAWDGSLAVPTKNAVYDQFAKATIDRSIKDGYRFDGLQLPSGAVFSRAAGPGAYRDSAGILQTAATNAPRFTYRWDTVALAWVASGLILEPEGINLSGVTEDFGSSYWTRSSVTVASAVGPMIDGVRGMDLLTNVSSLLIYNNTAWTTVIGNTYTVSFYFKQGATPVSWLRIYIGDNTFTTNGTRLWFNPTTGAIGNITVSGTGWVAGTGVITPFDNGIFRVAFTFVAGATTTYMRLATATTNGGGANMAAGAEFYMWGVQFEAGPKATSYIRNTGTGTATRYAETLTLDWNTPRYKPASMSVRYTFGDGTSQTVTGVALAAGIQTVPTNLNAATLKYISDVT